MENFRKLAFVAVIILLFAGLIGPRAFTAGTTEYHAHPALLELAAQTPKTMVSVIVQKASQSGQPEQLVEMLGGRVTRNLSIINAFAAVMPAEKARELSASPFVKWVSLDARMRTSLAPDYMFTTWANKASTQVPMSFLDSANMLSPAGPDGQYAWAGPKNKGAVTGFTPEYTPGLAIMKVEVAVILNVPVKLGSKEFIKFTPFVSGKALASANLSSTLLAACATDCVQYVNITGKRIWKWSEIAAMQLVIDQGTILREHGIYYDAVGIRVTAGEGIDSGAPITMSAVTGAPINVSVLANQFNKVVRATDVWNEAPGYYQGQNITVAVVDSGSFKSNAIGPRLVGQVNFNSAEHLSNDGYGHGTFVAGLIADDGSYYSAGKYMGVAPKTNVLAIRVADDLGASNESDLISALQWIYNNKGNYNIRVVNLSLNSSVAQSYHTSPLDAACEILWFNGITVVVSAGNNGSASLFPPANDPFVITVGATNDAGTLELGDDIVTSYSAYGLDETGGTKPDLVAPGANLIAYLPNSNLLTIPTQHPANVVDTYYFRLSGTSMAAPIVTGSVAILLNASPNLNPDQIKYRLKANANRTWPGYDPAKAGAGLLDVYAAVHNTTTGSANKGLPASNLLTTGTSPVNSSVAWNSVAWNSVAWNSVAWNSVAWNSVAWNSVAWNSDYWGE